MGMLGQACKLSSGHWRCSAHTVACFRFGAAERLIRLQDALSRLPTLATKLRELDSDLAQNICRDMAEFPHWVEELDRALVEQPPVVIRDGGVIARGYDEELDELQGISENAG